MFRIMNGWTKKKMIKAIMKGNNGTISMRNSGGMCAYRGKGNNKCAAGCFIPDELYNPKMDSRGLKYNNIGIICKLYPELKAKMPLGLQGMNALQYVHDITFYAQDPRPALIKFIETKCEE